MNDLITIEHAGAKLTISQDALFQAWLEKHITKPTSKASPFAIPTLREGERYVKAIVNADGSGYHLIRMSLDNSPELKWPKAMDHAMKMGGELPDRVESALLFATRAEGEFLKEWYWTREQRADNGDYVWCQYFGNGLQNVSRKSDPFRVVLVRRVPFTH